MGALREYLGVLLAVCLVALPGLLLPRAARAALDRTCREALIMPTQVLTSWVLARAWDIHAGRQPAGTSADADVYRQFVERRWQAVRPLPEGHGFRGTRIYRAAHDLALRERYVALRQFARGPVLWQRAEPFREGVRLACGSRQGVTPGAPVFTATGCLAGLVDATMPLTCTMSHLGADHIRLFCDVLGRDGVQGILVGEWKQRRPAGPDARAGRLELQIASRGIAVSVGDAVVTSSAAATAAQGLLPGGIHVGWIDAVETTEEGYVRARVKVPLSSDSRVLYAVTRLAVSEGIAVERDPQAAQARYMAELRRVQNIEQDLIQGAVRQLMGIMRVGSPTGALARVAFAIKSRQPDSFYQVADPAGAAALGLRPGVACLANGGLAGVLVRENDALRLRLLTSTEMAVRVDVVQPNGRRYRGLLAAADGPQALEPVPEGWVLPGHPRLQLVSLENEGLPVLLPADVVTAAGGVLALPPGIPVGTLVAARDDPFTPGWQVQPYVDFGALTYCTALVPTVTDAVTAYHPTATLRRPSPEQVP
jgi:cell shape-determining protein MreC